MIAGEGCATYLMGCAFRGTVLATEELAKVEETLEYAGGARTALAYEYGEVLKLKEFFKKELIKLTEKY